MTAFPLFARFSPTIGQWVGPITLDEVARSLILGEISPDEQLVLWRTDRWCRLEQLVSAMPEAFDSALGSTSWFLVLPTGAIHGPIDIKRSIENAATTNPGARVVCSLLGARPLPLGWLGRLHRPAQAATPPAEIPWGKILLGALAVGGVYLAYRKLTDDPEPKRIREIAEGYERDGASVWADIKGWPQPPLLNGRRPDVFAKFSCGFREAVEVENDRSIDRSHARAQIADLSRWEARTKRTAFFVDVVKGGRGGKAA